MILVDTSVWIEMFRSTTPLDMESVVPFDEIVTCLPVIQEVLQGIDDERAFRRAESAMVALPIVENPLSSQVFDDAIGLYRSARRLGISVRSSVDCLIAACALRNGLEVLHSDRDFDGLARVSGLRARRLHA